MSVESALKRNIVVTIRFNGCVIGKDTPTGVTANTHTTIDLFFTNLNTSKLRSGVFSPDVSGHIFVFLGINTRTIVRNRQKAIILFQRITLRQAELFQESGWINWLEFCLWHK